MGQETGTVQVHFSPIQILQDSIQVESYFWAGGEEREKKRDQKRLIRSQDNNREGEVIATGLLDKSPDLLNRTVVEATRENTPLQVLDVGSCYNPFGHLENWQV